MPQEKVIVTAALTGSVHYPSMSPYLPLNPKQIIEDGVRSAEAGAAVLHIHVRNPENGMPTPDLDIFREVLTGIKAKTNAVICLSTGGGMGMSTEQRATPLITFKPEMASLNFGSMNFSVFPGAEKIKEWKYPWERLAMLASEDYIFPNTFKTMREFLSIFAANETKPELELYDLGMVNNVAFMINRGHLKPPVHLQFVTGILGGVPSTVNSLVTLVNACREAIGVDNFTWSAIGSGRYQMPICAVALAMGGSVRVGLEDSLYISKGVLAKSSAEHVEKIIRIMRELSLEPATPEETRKTLRLKGSDKVNF
ncbi:MAG: 3-keto-5-aminohexanoate cleavage protein [Dehalococcoidia bacterium]|nr:3-keto-5-aminohexanoate cleavage protein [Dehalococcoidia bacterium]MDD5493055.1 3-keto-5-aminohexanoate cleavage protein [Dehalococcoidia bacterium]